MQVILKLLIHKPRKQQDWVTNSEKAVPFPTASTDDRTIKQMKRKANGAVLLIHQSSKTSVSYVKQRRSAAKNNKTLIKLMHNDSVMPLKDQGMKTRPKRIRQHMRALNGNQFCVVWQQYNPKNAPCTRKSKNRYIPDQRNFEYYFRQLANAIHRELMLSVLITPMASPQPLSGSSVNQLFRF